MAGVGDYTRTPAWPRGSGERWAAEELPDLHPLPRTPARLASLWRAMVALCSAAVGLSIPVDLLSILDRSHMEGSSLLAKIKTLSNLPEPVKVCSLLEGERNTIWGRGYKIHLQGI